MCSFYRNNTNILCNWFTHKHTHVHTHTTAPLRYSEAVLRPKHVFPWILSYPSPSTQSSNTHAWNLCSCFSHYIFFTGESRPWSLGPLSGSTVVPSTHTRVTCRGQWVSSPSFLEWFRVQMFLALSQHEWRTHPHRHQPVREKVKNDKIFIMFTRNYRQIWRSN